MEHELVLTTKKAFELGAIIIFILTFQRSKQHWQGTPVSVLPQVA